MKITIELTPADLVAAITQLGGALAQHKLPPVYPFSGGSVTIAQLDPAGELEFVQKVDPPVTRNGFTYAPVEPEASTTLAPEPEVASSTLAPEPPAISFVRTPQAPKPAIKKPTAQQRLAASKVGADLAAKRATNGAGMEFEEFDAMVKREVKRLAAGNTMPSHALWNEMRDPKLPVLSSVMHRYGASSAEELARMLGYNPPLRGLRPQRPAGEETQEAEAVPA
jgi:hypothetical protein